MSTDVPVDFARIFDALPTAYLVMDREFVIVAANPAYLRNVGRTREDIVGRYVFEAFPPDPDAPNTVLASFTTARDTGLTDTMDLVRYDIPDASGSGFVERIWSLITAPVLDADGQTVYVMQRNEDVTDFVHDREAGLAQQAEGEQWRRRVEEVETDLYARGRELRTARDAEAQAVRRLAALAAVTLSLANARTPGDLAESVVGAGFEALGVERTSVVLKAADGWLDVVTSGSVNRDVLEWGHRLPPDYAVPVAETVRTGEAVLLRHREESAAWSPEMAEVVGVSGCEAWVTLPLRVGDRTLGALSLGWKEPQPTLDLEPLLAFASQVALALDHLQVLEAEQVANAAARQLSETLQRSLLTAPSVAPDLQVAVRYQPAASEAQVGGDWYDAFTLPTGDAVFVVGDVSGHDGQAAAVMGQVRNVLRGVAQTTPHPPATVLTTLDRVLDSLEVGVLATAVLAKLVTAVPGSSGRVLQWSNAGHPPPVLLTPGRGVQLLQRAPDLLLGLDAGTGRSDHEVLLAPGSTVVLYTDGLIERRGESLDDGLAWLLETCTALARGSAEQIAEGLLTALSGVEEDDIALLVLRVADAGELPECR